MLRWRYPQLRDELVGSWCPSLGVTGLTLRDHSGFANHARLTNMDPATDWVRSGGQYAIDSDATDDYLLLSTANNFPLADSPRTLCAWVNMADFSNYGIIFDIGQITPLASSGLFIAGAGGYNVGMVNGNIVWELNTTTAWGNGVIPTGRFVHCAMVYPGGAGVASARFYIDGVLQTTASGVNSVPNTVARLDGEIAGRYAGTKYGAMQIDGVNIYSRALNPGEIRTLVIGRGIEHEQIYMPLVRGFSAPLPNSKRRRSMFSTGAI